VLILYPLFHAPTVRNVYPRRLAPVVY